MKLRMVLVIMMVAAATISGCATIKEGGRAAINGRSVGGAAIGAIGGGLINGKKGVLPGAGAGYILGAITEWYNPPVTEELWCHEVRTFGRDINGVPNNHVEEVCTGDYHRKGPGSYATFKGSGKDGDWENRPQ